MSSIPYGFYSGHAFLDLPCDAESWLIHPIIPRGGWVNLYGAPKKARKTYLALGASWAVSTGQDKWLGFDVRDAGPVLYVQADTPHNLWRDRVQDVQSGGYDLSNVWFASLMTMPYPFNIAEHEDILQSMVDKVDGDPVMIVYDTGRALHTFDENSSQEMTMFMHALTRVAGRQAKLLITHDKKGPSEGSKEEDTGAEGGDLMRGNRGSSAVAGAVDTSIKMTPKGYMYYQGRAVGEQHKRLSFNHVHSEGQCPHDRIEDCSGFIWEEDIHDEVVVARNLIELYPQGSERSLARLLAKQMAWTDDKAEVRARGIIQRQKKGTK